MIHLFGSFTQFGSLSQPDRQTDSQPVSQSVSQSVGSNIYFVINTQNHVKVKITQKIKTQKLQLALSSLHDYKKKIIIKM